jgi:hypothetical protein
MISIVLWWPYSLNAILQLKYEMILQMQSVVCLCLISLLIRFPAGTLDVPVVPIVQGPFRVIQRGKFKKWVVS